MDIDIYRVKYKLWDLPPGTRNDDRVIHCIYVKSDSHNDKSTSGISSELLLAIEKDIFKTDRIAGRIGSIDSVVLVEGAHILEGSENGLAEILRYEAERVARRNASTVADPVD